MKIGQNLYDNLNAFDVIPAFPEYRTNGVYVKERAVNSFESSVVGVFGVIKSLRNHCKVVYRHTGNYSTHDYIYIYIY